MPLVPAKAGTHALDCFAHARNDKPFSRRAARAMKSYSQTPSPPDIAVRKTASFHSPMPVVHADSARRVPVESTSQAPPLHQRKKEKIGSETPTDARLLCRAEGAQPRPLLYAGEDKMRGRTSVGVPPRLLPEGLSSQRLNVRPGFPERGRYCDCYPLLLVAVQRSTSRSCHSAGGMMPGTARD